MSRATDVRTVNDILDREASAHPERWFLRFPDDDLTYGAFQTRTRRLARGLHRDGVGTARPESGPPPPLPTLLPNCADQVALWFATNRNGGIWAPINTEFRGAGLAHALNLTGSPDAVVDGALLGPLIDVASELDHLERVFIRGTDGVDSTTLPWEARALDTLLDTDTGAGASPQDAEPSDTSLLIYTSGTTGPSKACGLSHAYVLAQSDLLARSVGIRPDDILYCPYPLFHWDATIGTVVPALLRGTTAVLAERFSVSGFWRDVRHYGVTVFDFMGATLSFLHKQPRAEDDPHNPARLGWGVPMPAFKADFEERFGLTLVEGYGSTEGGIMVYQEPGRRYPAGSCGQPLPEFDLRIADPDGSVVETGAVGEILVRPTGGQSRHLMMTGYFGMPDATHHAFRDGWFHTGDLGRLDEWGNLYFEGRTKDVIRRRGENISAFEVEQAVSAHPDVVEAAAYGVASPDTEEEVALAVVVRPGRELSTDALLGFCRERMARFMVPTHVRFVDRLPRTPTEKVAKSVVKTWHHAGPGDTGTPR